MKNRRVMEVKPGQVWKDNDIRSAVDEFTVLEVKGNYAICQRGPRKTRIRLDRLLLTQHGRGYTYIGKKR